MIKQTLILITFLITSVMSESGTTWVNYRARNPQKGGWVSYGASVDETVFIAPTAKVRNSASITGKARIYGSAVVKDEAIVEGNARVYGNAIVGGEAIVKGKAKISGHAKIGGDAVIDGNCIVKGYSVINSGHYSSGIIDEVNPQIAIDKRNRELERQRQKRQQEANAIRLSKEAQKRDYDYNIKELNKALMWGDNGVFLEKSYTKTRDYQCYNKFVYVQKTIRDGWSNGIITINDKLEKRYVVYYWKNDLNGWDYKTQYWDEWRHKGEKSTVYYYDYVVNINLNKSLSFEIVRNQHYRKKNGDPIVEKLTPNFNKNNIWNDTKIGATLIIRYQDGTYRCLDFMTYHDAKEAKLRLSTLQSLYLGKRK